MCKCVCLHRYASWDHFLIGAYAARPDTSWRCVCACTGWAAVTAQKTTRPATLRLAHRTPTILPTTQPVVRQLPPHPPPHVSVRCIVKVHAVVQLPASFPGLEALGHRAATWALVMDYVPVGACIADAVRDAGIMSLRQAQANRIRRQGMAR